MKHDAIWFESAIARENAKLKPQPLTPKPAPALPQTETCSDGVYLSFPHLNLILILDQQFYRHTLRALLQSLRAALIIKDGRILVRYIKSGTQYPLERLVVARSQDFWSVRLRRENAQTQGKLTADYRASNIIVEKSADDRARGLWLSEEAQRNHDKPNRMFAIRSDITGEYGTDTGLHRINQILDADFIPDRPLPEKPTGPKGHGTDEKGENEEGNGWTGAFYGRGNPQDDGVEETPTFRKTT